MDRKHQLIPGLVLTLLSVTVSGCLGQETFSRRGVRAYPALISAASCIPALTARGERDAIIEAAVYVRDNHRRFFVDGATRSDAYDMMTIVINILRANGHDVRRTLAHADQPPSNPYRWGSDALVFKSSSRAMVYDIYVSWPVPATPNASEHGEQEGEVTADLVAIGSGAGCEGGGNPGGGSSGGGSTTTTTGGGGQAGGTSCGDLGSYTGQGYQTEQYCRHTYGFQTGCTFTNGCWRPDLAGASCIDLGSYSGRGYTTKSYCEHTYSFQKTCSFSNECWRPNF
jgi:hypothetical protein